MQRKKSFPKFMQRKKSSPKFMQRKKSISLISENENHLHNL